MQRAHASPPVTERRPLLSTRAAADTVACDVITIRRAIHKGALEAVRLGEHGDFRIAPAALDAWLHPAQSEDTRS